MTILEAVNYILTACGMPTVASVPASGLAYDASFELAASNTRIQGERSWFYNTIHNKEYEPDEVTSKISMSGVIRFSNSSKPDVAIRNGYLYDLYDETDEFDSSVYLDAVIEQTFTTLTETQAEYITADAAWRFQRKRKRDKEDDDRLGAERALARVRAIQEDMDMSGSRGNLLSTRRMRQSRGE